MISTHTHVETTSTASTMQDFIAEALKLNRKYLAYTDIGLMTGLFKFYKLAKDVGIKTIPGIELYFKHPTDLPSKLYPKAGYFTITIYPKDEASFYSLCQLTSKVRPFYTDKIDNDVPLYDWNDLESLKGNFEGVLSGIHSMLVKPLLSGKKIKDVEPILIRLQKIMNVNVALVGASQDAYYRTVLAVETNKSTLELYRNDKVDTIKAGRTVKGIPAFDLEKGGHIKIVGLHRNGIWHKANLDVRGVKFVDKFTKLSSGDLLAKANKAHLAIAQMYNLPVLSSDYAFMSSKESKQVQDIRLEGYGLQPSFYMLSDKEYVQAITDQGIKEQTALDSIAATEKWAEMFSDFKLNYKWRLPKVTEDSNKYMLELIKKTGRMKWDDPVWVDRIKLELNVISKNGVYDLLPYFFPIAMVFDLYKSKGRLTGPSRGSVGGSLLAYVMGFTHLNPLDYDLPFERFFSMDRILNKKLPDVDVDLPDRTLLVGEDGQSGFLHEHFGHKSGQISTRGMIRLKSAIKDVNRIHNKGIVEPSIEKFSESLPAPPQGVNDRDFVFGFKNEKGERIKDDTGEIKPSFFEISKELQDYAKKRPEEWAVVSKILGIPRQNSRHASAFVIADEDLHSIVPMMSVNGVGKVTQWEAKEVENAGLIKYDFLCITQLLDIEKCLELLNKKENYQPSEPGWFKFNGKEEFVWNLPKEDEKTAAMLAEGDTETVFQVNTKSMLPFVTAIKPKSIIDLATILALVRPGPLDFINESTGLSMAEEYIERRQGRGTYDLPELVQLLPETYGVIVFQEQLTKVAKNLAGFSGEKAEILRENMCKKKMKQLMLMKPDFIAGAKQNVSEEVAEKVWNMMETFGQYGFSIIHSVGYAMITYATAFLKAHYPLEWWTAVLSNSDTKEINEKYWKHVRNIVAPPDINLSGSDMIIDYKTNKIRSKLTMITGLSKAGVDKLVESRPFTSIEDYATRCEISPSMSRKLIAVGVMDNLFDNNETFLTKMQMFEDALEKKKLKEKLEEYEEKVKAGKKPKKPELKQGKIDPSYIGLSPLDFFALKKTILPSMPISLTDLGAELDLVSKTEEGKLWVPHPKYNGKEVLVLNGQQIAQAETYTFKEFKTLACLAYVVEAKEFTFKKDATKKALKLLIDTDNYLRELIVWPDYDTGRLIYPQGLEKGSVGLFYINKRKEKADASIGDIILFNKN